MASIEVKTPWLDGFRYNIPGQYNLQWDSNPEFTAGNQSFMSMKALIVEEAKRAINGSDAEGLKITIATLQKDVEELKEQIKLRDERWGKF